MPRSIDPLIHIAQRGIAFTASDGQAFVRLAVPASGGFFILPVHSPAYRDWFFYQFFAQYDTLPTANAFHAVLNHLDAQANENGENTHLAVFRRVGARATGISPDQILLDLANPERQFVEISPGGWTVAAGINALFQTSRSSAPLPAPVQASDDAPSAPLDVLRSCLNLSCRADWLRCLAWILAALRPHGPFPFLILQGPPLSGKSLAARMLRALIDPNASPLSPTPSSVRDLLTLARHSWILAFDHISALSPPLTDALCRLSSGVGVAFREIPRAASEPLLQNYKRPILLTVTDRWSAPADLVDRSLTVTFPPLAPHRRRAEADLFTEFNDARPAILAAICSAVSTALSRLSHTNLHLSRCADALAWAMAASPSLGCTAEEMRQAFAPSLPPHPLVDAIRALVSGRPHWTGTAAQLLKICQPTLSCHQPQGLARQLRLCAPILADSGIEVNFRRSHGGVKVIELRARKGDDPPEKPSPQSSPAFQPSLQLTETEALITA